MFHGTPYKNVCTFDIGKFERYLNFFEICRLEMVIKLPSFLNFDNTVETRFYKPPRETEIGSKNQRVRQDWG